LAVVFFATFFVAAAFFAFFAMSSEMMQVWADYLDQLRHGSSTDQGVQPFTRSQR
jgi:hypothetical protein